CNKCRYLRSWHVPPSRIDPGFLATGRAFFVIECYPFMRHSIGWPGKVNLRNQTIPILTVLLSAHVLSASLIPPKTERRPHRKIVHILGGSGLLEKITRKKVRVISGECEVPPNSPLQHYLCLVAYVTSIAGLSRLDDVDRRTVDAVVSAF